MYLSNKNNCVMYLAFFYSVLTFDFNTRFTPSFFRLPSIFLLIGAMEEWKTLFCSKKTTPDFHFFFAMASTPTNTNESRRFSPLTKFSKGFSIQVRTWQFNSVWENVFSKLALDARRWEQCSDGPTFLCPGLFKEPFAPRLSNCFLYFV